MIERRKHSTKRPVMATIAVLMVVGFFTILGALIYAAFVKISLDGTLKDVLLVMLGTLGTLTTMVMNFYFGSTASSQNKDALLAAKPPV